YMARVEKRCRRNPVVGITTAMVSINAVVSHCACTAVMPRSSMRCGIATPIVVSFNIATNAAPSMSQIARDSSGESCVRAVPGDGWEDIGDLTVTGKRGVECDPTPQEEC